MATNYVICAAGAGARLKTHIAKPKPIIKLKGKFLIEWALDSLPIFYDDKITIITQKSDSIIVACKEILHRKYHCQIEWVEIEKLTRGQLETAYLAKDVVDLNKGVAFFNCDTFFQCRNLISMLDNSEVDGLIPCSIMAGDSWSFCKIDEKNKVQEVREKQRISDWASVGFYYFKDSKYFFKKAKEYLDEFNLNTEIYIAPFYNKFIDEGNKIFIEKVDLFLPMGTMEDINGYWNLGKSEFVAENMDSILVVDLDNTITIESRSEDYDNKKPNIPLINKLIQYQKNGYKIIVHTSRRMETCKNNEAEVLANVGKSTLLWLEKHNVPFDGIKFGKPYAKNGFYIDDKAIRPSDFLAMEESEIFDLMKK